MPAMLKSYFLTALRNIIRNRIQSVIQVVSLVIGITAMILIGLYARNELSYDRFNDHFDRIYRLEFGDRVGQPTAPGHQIKQHFSEVENVVRLVNWLGRENEWTVEHVPEDDTSQIISIKVSGLYWCDSTLFDVFSFEFIQGNPATALKDPTSIALSESMARRFFGDEDPFGKRIWGGAVSAIFKDLKNSHFQPNMLLPMMSFEEQHGIRRGDPGFMNDYMTDHSFITYLLLPESGDPAVVENRINEYFRENTPVESGIDFDKASYSMRPLKEVYFATGLTMEKDYCRHGNIKTLRIIITIAAFILVLAVINYVNLTTARISLRAREVGIRKVTGSSREMLIGQFLTESVVVTAISFLLALILATMLLPGFNRIVLTDMGLVFLFSPVTWLIFILSVFFLGILSGIYPAVLLTRFQPVESLSGNQVRGTGSVIFRRFLMILQFFISVSLVIGVLVVFRQLNYMKKADLGFNKEALLNTTWYLWSENQTKRDLVREELERIPGVNGVAFSAGMMGSESMVFPFALSHEGKKLEISYMGIDPEFLDLMEIEVIEGRNFSRDRPADYDGGKCLINEAAARAFELGEPVGTFLQADQGFSMEIIGMVEDIHYRSHHERIEPYVYLWFRWLSMASIKLKSMYSQETLDQIGKKIESLEPGYSFDYSFLEDTYERQYLKDEQAAKIVRNFAIVALLLASLGLFGLSSFMAVRRTKEIGIRKINGASVPSLFFLLSMEYIRWVTIALVMACPVSWWILKKWLQGFAYHTRVAPWIFLVAALVAYVVTLLTVAWLSLKMARANPVDSLRYE